MERATASVPYAYTYRVRLEWSAAMNIQSFLLLMIFALTTVTWAQSTPVQAPVSGPGRAQLQAEHRREMMEMHQHEMEAMKADVDKMKSSLAQMKANLLTIRDRNEMDRWRNNIDMWDAMVDHMDRMLKHMESMGSDATAPDVGGHPPAAPTEKKPE
jgi:hypothetical protein